MNWHLIISLLLVLDIILEIVRCLFFKQKQRASSEEALRQRNETVVACLECGADLVRVDRRTEMDFTPFVDGVWPKPVKEGEIFLSCPNGCGKHKECPVLKRLGDLKACHFLGAADGVRIVKSKTFHKDGSAAFVLDDIPNGKRIRVSGAVIEGKGNLRCYVRSGEPVQRVDDANDGREGNDRLEQ